MVRLILIFIIALLPVGLRAQQAGAHIVPGDTAVSLVTMYAGSDIYELEGHTMLRITMPDGDFAVSYGTFDFEAPNFVYRFVKGETDYWVTTYPGYPMEMAYASQGRRVVEQRLAMTSAQKKRLIDLVAENLKPENATYRYNYVKDNCATRPLRIVELAMGDSIMLGKPGTQFAGLDTWRKVMQHCHANYPWYQFGIDLALGPGIDIPLDNRQLAFAPVILCDQLEDATVGGKRLVVATTIVNDVADDNALEAPTPWPLTPLALMLVVMVAVMTVCAYGLAHKKVVRIVYALFYTVLTLVGCLLTFLVFISVHEATSPNPLLAVFNPLCIIGVITIYAKRLKTLGVRWYALNVAAIVGLITYYIISGNPVNDAFWPIFAADLALSANYIYITCKTKKQHTTVAA